MSLVLGVIGTNLYIDEWEWGEGRGSRMKVSRVRETITQVPIMEQVQGVYSKSKKSVDFIHFFDLNKFLESPSFKFLRSLEKLSFLVSRKRD